MPGFHFYLLPHPASLTLLGTFGTVGVDSVSGFTEAAPGKIDFARCDAWFSFLFVAASRYADLAWNLWDSWR